MSGLFDETTISTMQLKNRFVRSATWTGLALRRSLENRTGAVGPDEKGLCSLELILLTQSLARGQLGLIITGHAYVCPEGQAGKRQLSVCTDAHVPGLAKMAKVAHTDGAKIALQLAHAGAVADATISEHPALGPSPIIEKDKTLGRAMSTEEIAAVGDAFGKAAVRAKEAGFDAVQLHAAHGYLLSQFLSPYYNKRTDEYGGSLENRMRIVREALAKVRAAVGSDFPVLIKLNSEDFLEGGLSVDEMLEVCAALATDGLDACELSGGTRHSGRTGAPSRLGDPASPEQEAYYRTAAQRYKARIQIPLILVGGIRSYEAAAALVENGTTDYIAFSRPLIREPALVARWQSGNTSRATCISCSHCFRPARQGDGIQCTEDADPEKE